MHTNSASSLCFSSSICARFTCWLSTQHSSAERNHPCSSKPCIVFHTCPRQEYCDAFEPTSVQLKLPPPLSQLGDELHAQCVNLSFGELLVKADEVFKSLTFTQEQIACLECMTRTQSNSKSWFAYRSGRITASVFRSAVTTDPANPAVSTIKRVCYPDAYKFSTAATRWGCNHEKTALQTYLAQSELLHANHQIQDCGFYIDPNHPFIGASPDSLIECPVCGPGCVEVKCPHCVESLSCGDENRKDFCLEKDANSVLRLKRTHSYFFQVQVQMACTQRGYCDFVVWLSNTEVHIERIHYDDVFFQQHLSTAEAFFKTCILPELIAKCFSMSRSASIPSDVKYLCPNCSKLARATKNALKRKAPC
ncbi:hypothetical protein CAPTEDRAFT_217374 [Capitella teleta]|uniref:YqaJ viral recombinase domain-containing protein n=1 Tax=Capitella teleta TaxID=283909 RepID=R7VDN5_CAPTE|nr:hypothetical protein CAPTEDRAFT_217374 [Capitella teleta]|eukprot:ELU16729.1 hypothetical protein CAPTEDRAFT_217374 [Capitella teleta]